MSVPGNLARAAACAMLVLAGADPAMAGPPSADFAPGALVSPAAVGATLRGFLLDRGVFSKVGFPGAARGSSAFGINDAGFIAGSFEDTRRTVHGYLTDGTTYKQIDVAGARSTGAFRVNAAGQVAGYTSSTRPDPDLESTGYVLTDGEVATVSFPGAAQTQVFGLGDGGAVLGRFGTDLRVSGQAFVLRDGVYTALDIPGAVSSAAYDVNDRGQIVGWYRDKTLTTHGFLLDGGAVTTIDVPVPGNFGAVAAGINNDGQIVGSYLESGDISHGYLLTGDTFVIIDVPGAVRTFATDINNVGQIVGSFDPAR